MNKQLLESAEGPVEDASSLKSLASRALEPIFWTPERLGSPSAWWTHVPFAFWITAVTKPRLLVELGTHYGVSYSAFCESVVRSRLATRCYAIDTWLGDAHAGSYDNSVLIDLRTVHDARYSAFSELIQSTFDDAIAHFEDTSIDILHIDGYHSYEAVKHDFETWLPKLSQRGIVLLHDTNVRQDQFGVAKLWLELTKTYPSFEFQHGHGLGVLAVGRDVPSLIGELCSLSDHNEIAAIRERFSVVGSRWHIQTQKQIESLSITKQLDEAERHTKSLAAQLTQSDADILALRTAQAKIERELALAEGKYTELITQFTKTESALSAAESDRSELQHRVSEIELAHALAEENRSALAGQLSASMAYARAEELGNQTLSERLLSAKGQLETSLKLIDRLVEQNEAFVNVEPFRLSLLDRLRAKVRTLPKEQKARFADRSTTVVRHSLFFDPKWYLAKYPDVAAAGIDPAEHYSTFGAKEGRDPGPNFSTTQYLEDNPDITHEEINPLVHFELYGRKEGRKLPFVVKTESDKSPSIVVERVRERLNRIIYVSGEPDTPGNRYRVLRYVEAAQRLGYHASWVRIEDLPHRMADVQQTDILIVWRASWNQSLSAAMSTVRSRGGKVVFDVDDLMIEPDLARAEIIDAIRSQFLPEDAVQHLYANIRRTMMEADVCLATTDELAYFMRRPGKTAFVLPNGYDQATHDVSRLARRRWKSTREDDFIRIGYAAGSRTHQRDLRCAIEALARILRETPNCRFVLFEPKDGGKPCVDIQEFPILRGLEDQIEWRPLQTLENLPYEMARFDINLAPLEVGNPFCEAKSELKFFESALVGVPTIASPTGPFRRAIDHGKTGYLAVSSNDWYFYLKQLVDNPELRSRLGHEAYHATLAKFGPLCRARDLAGMLDQLRGGMAAVRAFAFDKYLAVKPWQSPKVFPSDVIFETDKQQSAEVTVVIPLYNYRNFVLETLESVKCQTLTLLDLVVVDGCSTDDSLAVATQWVKQNAERFNRVIVLKNKQNYGLGFCRNSGFDAAETSYVLPLDADNKLRPECCQDLLDVVKSTGAAFAYSVLQKFGAFDGWVCNHPYEPQRFVGGNFIDAMALVAKEAWAMVGGIDHVKYGWEDYDFWCRLAEIGLHGEWVSRPVVEYRVHSTSMMTTQTKASDNYARLMDNFTQRHPWVSLVEQKRWRRLPLPSDDSQPIQRSRLETILPLLRCPDTGQKLAIDSESSQLVTLDSTRAWPIIDGRAVLSPGLSRPEIKPVDHVSNELSEGAIKLIENSRGPVLNLSAGASARKYDHVIEAEYAIFRHTDVVADAHRLPFDDEAFEAVIVMNAFEHYRNPKQAASEVFRVLKPGGRVLLCTAFLQPQHEAPWHFYNCTRYGLAEWFKDFETEHLYVSDNFCPNYSIAWLASECEIALRGGVSPEAADNFASASIGDLVALWRDPARRNTALWTNFHRLSQEKQEGIAAGFEFLGRRPLKLPQL